MPYKTIEAAKAANFPTVKEKADLTLEQINKLAEIFDAIKAGGNVDNPMAFAWNAWKNVYKKAGDVWVLAEDEQEAFETWLPIAKAEQERHNKDGTTTILTGDALKSNGPSLSGGKIKINHKALLPGLKVPEIKYEHPFLLMNTSDKDIHALFKSSDATGWSVDLANYVEEDDKITAFEGGGISILYHPHIPTCTPAMGCFETFKTPSQNSNHDVKSSISRLWSAIKGATTAIEQIKTKKEGEENRQETPDNIEMEKIEELAANLATTKVDLVTKTAEFEQLKVATEDSAEKLKAQTAEFETYKTVHEDELKKANDKLAEFERKDLDRIKATLASQWETFKKDNIPPGLVHKPEDEKKLREQFETNPYEFMNTLLGFKQEDGTGKEGDEFATTPDKLAKDAKDLEDAAEMEGPSYGN
jgi:hypothetical protein